MSLKGTATLTAAFLLPTWPSRIVALGVIAAIGVLAFIRYRRRKPLSPQNPQNVNDLPQS